MAREFCLPERTSKLFLGIILLIGGLGLIVIGLTILPIIGLFLAVPFLVLSYYFFSRKLDDQCNIKTG